MLPTDHVFELIQKLGHGEVKHFRRQARQNPNQGANNYLRLFEALLEEEEYDEARIKGKFAGEGLEKNFANVKRYLYQQVLGFLARREAENDPRSHIEMQLQEAEVLWKKGLYGQSAKRFGKAARAAGEAEMFDLEVFALGRLQRDHIANAGKNAWGTLQEFAQMAQAAMRKWTELQELRLLRNQLFALSRQFFDLQRPEALALAEGCIQHPLLQRPLAEIDFFEGRRLYRNCHAYLAMLKGDRETYARSQKAIVQAWEDDPAQIRRNRRMYRLDLANQLGAYGALMDFSDFPDLLARLHALPSSGRDEEGEVFQNSAFFELLYLMNAGQFGQARERLPAIEAGLREFSGKLSQARLLAFRYNMMVLNFMLEDYRVALGHLNLILHDERTEHRQDIQQVARLFLLIFHFELGNLDLMEYLFRAAYRYLYVRGSLGRFERAVLAFLRKTANLPPGPAMFPAFVVLRDDLQAMVADSGQRIPPGAGEIIYWLRSKLEKRPIVEIASEA